MRSYYYIFLYNERGQLKLISKLVYFCDNYSQMMQDIPSWDKISKSNQLDRLSYSSNFVSCIKTTVSDFHYCSSIAFVYVFQFIMYTSTYSKDLRKVWRHKKGYVGRYDKRIYFSALNHSNMETLSSLMFFYMMSTDTENRFTRP